MRTGKVLLLLLLLMILFPYCSEKETGSYIMTVKGPVSPELLIQTLSHEHLLVDWAGADSTGYHRWDRDSVIQRVLPFLAELKSLGVNGFVDCSPAYLGRDPVVLRQLSEKTGIHIITNTGYYGAVNNRFIPDFAWDESAQQIAGRWIDEFNTGIDGSGIKPGFIKIGVNVNSPLSEIHRKLVRAAAITHLQTGLVIKSHTGGDVPAFEQLEILREEGVSPDAFIWTHAQRGSIEKITEAAAKGAWISLDAVNASAPGGEGSRGNIQWYTERLKQMKNSGLLHRVLISHDAGWYTAGEPGGGSFRGFGDIHNHLLPSLRENGFTDSEIETLISLNPSRAFEVRVRLPDPSHSKSL